MILKEIFEKPIDRPIEGVIKADDQASLYLEIEEYVLTGEIERELGNFLDAYNDYQGANGVWISGFFGSGKSHLLKMLALVLENRRIDGTPALNLFLPKCGDNQFLRADLQRAAAIPSRSILFNIDQKADVISKKQVDALLAVFVKVFNEMCGYYGKQGHIAQFERDLDRRGLYEKFKNVYQKEAGCSWVEGREQAILESLNIARAYTKVTGSDESVAKGILDKYRKEYSVSIEDFAKMVRDYLDSQPPGFRLNFFVDEVGQYIAENVRLMTNLQTIAESLATNCRGRSWLVVTAQEELDSVVGEITNRSSNDFSKIQDRFKNRIKLTSRDVAEVIQKRLLMKNEKGIELLSGIYNAQTNNFRTLFDFADGSKTYRNFIDREHFVHTYPFIPYQFVLFQSGIQSLSQHNAFEGKHSSVGERSMLGVFQQVAIIISGHQIGELATFDLMFEGIRTVLKSNIQRAILQAEEHLGNPFAVRLLKALFLVKYIKEFKSTVRNLCVLILKGFDQDLSDLHNDVEEALNLLEQQTYIQRNGEFYEYLTDEEKDVEQEIKNTEVETQDVLSELGKLTFDHVLKARKIRYDQNRHDYPFSRRIDDQLFGREYELSINVITPFHENAGKDAHLRIQSMARNELMVILPSDDRLIRDLLMYKRTEKYIRQNVSLTQQESIKRILAEKAQQNQGRYKGLQERIQDLLGKAMILVDGKEIETAQKDAQSRIVKGFYELISRVYPNLKMLRGIDYVEKDVGKYIGETENSLFKEDVDPLSEAEQEMFAFIKGQKLSGNRITVKKLLEKFQKVPYGWYYAAILCILAMLYARRKVDVCMESQFLEDNELETALLNTHTHGNIYLEPKEDFIPSQVHALKDFYQDFFDRPAIGQDAKALGKEAEKALNDLITDMEELSSQAMDYPFINALGPEIKRFKKFTGKSYSWYVKEFVKYEDELLNLKENLLDPIFSFMKGPQKTIYDEVKRSLKEQAANLEYVNSKESREIREIIDDPECFRGNKMNRLRNMLASLKEKIQARVSEEIEKARKKVEKFRDLFLSMPEFSSLAPETQKRIKKEFENVLHSLESQDLIAMIRDKERSFEDNDYPCLLGLLTRQDPSKDYGSEASVEEVRESSVTSIHSITIPFKKPWLENESDVGGYLEVMQDVLLKKIKSGTKIQI